MAEEESDLLASMQEGRTCKVIASRPPWADTGLLAMEITDLLC